MLVALVVWLFCDPMGWCLPGASVHGILQARILEWVIIAFSRGSSWPRDWTRVSHNAGRFFTVWVTNAGLSSSVMSNSLRPHGLQPTRFLCPWGFSRQEYWSELPCPPPGDLPIPGIEPTSPALRVDSLQTEPPGKRLKH